MEAAPVRGMRGGERLSVAPLLVGQLRLGATHERGEFADGLFEDGACFLHAGYQLAVLVVRRARGVHPEATLTRRGGEVGSAG